jgi:hypothetical protein
LRLIFPLVVLFGLVTQCTHDPSAEGPRVVVPPNVVRVQPSATPPDPPKRWDWVGVIGTGQSLSVGAGAPAITTEQPFGNLKLAKRDATWSLVPLVEPIRPYPRIGDGQYPGNILGETPHSAMANQLTSLARADGLDDYVTIHSVVGWSGHCLSDIDQHGNGKAYPASLEEVRAIKTLADAQHRSFAVLAITLTHGECDSRNTDYERGLFRLWQDYDRDLRAITGQSDHVVLLESQQGTFPFENGVSEGTLAQWSVGVSHPNQVICVGPKYQYAYVADRIHMDAPSYRRLGEKYAEVMDRVVRRHESWAPLQPTSASRDGPTLVVHFHVPNPPLAWDESLAPPHQGSFVEWANGRGFEVEDERGAVAIASVELRGSDVVITPRGATRGSVTIRYATMQDSRRPAGGDVFGRRGQLRDSDPFVGWDTESIACRVERGSNVVTAIAPATFEARTARDLVTASDLQTDTIVLEKRGNGVLTISSPWDGPSGEATLEMHHDQRNYAVAFRVVIP